MFCHPKKAWAVAAIGWLAELWRRLAGPAPETLI